MIAENVITDWWGVACASSEPYRTWAQVSDWLFGACVISEGSDRETYLLLSLIALQRARMAADELYGLEAA